MEPAPRHAQRGAMRIEYYRKPVFGNQPQPEHISIESLGSGAIAGSHERDD